MPADDDVLREQLHRERSLHVRPADAADVLTGLRPAMRRARRRRVATSAAIATVALGGIAGAVQVVRVDRPNTIRIAAEPTSREPNASITAAPVVESSVVANDGHDATAPDSDDTAAPATDGIDVRSGTLASRPISVPDDSENDSTPTTTEAAIAVTGPVTVPAFPVTTSSTTSTTSTTSTVPSATDPPSTPTTSTTPRTPSTSSAPATTVARQPEWFDSDCGSASAIRWPDTVELIEVVPDPGYAYRVEDPDHGNVTIQFTGGGEDCELKITTLNDGDDD